jgi:hypothetical protein
LIIHDSVPEECARSQDQEESLPGHLRSELWNPEIILLTIKKKKSTKGSYREAETAHHRAAW